MPGKNGTSFTGAGYEGRPAPDEKSKPSTGKGSAPLKSTELKSANPYSASYDSRPQVGDNKKGATRPAAKGMTATDGKLGKSTKF